MDFLQVKDDGAIFAEKILIVVCATGWYENRN
jgi:hypothetical protein